MATSQSLPYPLQQTQLVSQANQSSAVSITQGVQLSGITIGTTATTVKTTLGRVQLGWFLTDQNTNATVWRSGTFNNSFMTLTASTECVVSIWVY